MTDAEEDIVKSGKKKSAELEYAPRVSAAFQHINRKHIREALSRRAPDTHDAYTRTEKKTKNKNSETTNSQHRSITADEESTVKRR